MKKRILSRNGKDRVVKYGVLAFCLYTILMSTATLWADGWIYRIVQPLPVVRQTEHSVTLQWFRYSRWPMRGKCSREIICDVGSDTYPISKPVMKPGWDVFDWDYVIPAEAAGKCMIRGMMEYDPIGKFGPRLVYYWESEEFFVTGSGTYKIEEVAVGRPSKGADK